MCNSKLEQCMNEALTNQKRKSQFKHQFPKEFASNTIYIKWVKWRKLYARSIQ